MSQESMKLYWINDNQNSNKTMLKVVKYRDCAFSARSSFKQLSLKLNTTPYILAIAVYVVLISKIFNVSKVSLIVIHGSQNHFCIDLSQYHEFREIVHSVKQRKDHEALTLNDYSFAKLGLSVSKNTIYFCFESNDTFVDGYLAKTMIQRYRELLKQIDGEPTIQLKKLNVFTSKEKKLFREWNEIKSRFDKNKELLDIMEQQITLIPRKLLAQYLKGF